MGNEIVATAHLLHGYLGAGKSTFARALTESVGGVCFDLDAWYLDLFTDGRPTDFVDYVLLDRLKDRISQHWPEVLGAGIDVVLDFGFWRRARRDEARRLAADAGGDSILYKLDVPDDVALGRCLARNGSPGQFVIDEAAFRDLRERFEPLAADEVHRLV